MSELIESLLASYEKALHREIEANDKLASAQAASEHRRAVVLLDAYATGRIDGKNESVRKMQETIVLDEDNALFWLETYERNQRLLASGFEAARRSLDAYISLTKADLYSQAGLQGVK